MQEQVVIKRPLLGNILFVFICAAFVVGSLFIIQILNENVFIRLIAIISIIFFGGGGLLYILTMAWKPIVIISNDGITVPFGWGKNFVSWENVDRFEVVEQVVNVGAAIKAKQKYIGVFVFDKKGIAGTGKISQTISQVVTNWEEVPAVLINLSLSFVKIEKVMGVLQEFHDKHKISTLSK